MFIFRREKAITNYTNPTENVDDNFNSSYESFNSICNTTSFGRNQFLNEQNIEKSKNFWYSIGVYSEYWEIIS